MSPQHLPMNISTSATIVFHAESAVALGSQLSRGNIFGFFVTLQICQLTQPHGSLLFRRVRGPWWRTNPVSSFIEAFIIFRYLVPPTWDLCKTLPSNITSARRKAQRDGLWKGLRSFGVPWRKHLCDPASALLLLRGAVGYEADAELLQKLMDDSFELQEARAVTMTPARSSSSLLGLPPRSATDENGQGRPNSNSESAPVVTGSEPQTSTPAEPITLQFPGVQRRWTELESGHPPRSQSNTIALAVDPDTNIERAKLLHRAFGSNALAHGEKQIDIVTTAATLVILLKLVIIHQAPWFMTYALLTIGGWMAVQSLLLLFHSREMSDVDMVASVRQARLINEDLLKTAHIWKGMYLVMHMPILGYVSYLIAFRFRMPDGLDWLGKIAFFYWLAISGPCIIVGSILIALGGAMGTILCLYGLFWSIFIKRSLEYAFKALMIGLGCALSSCFGVWVFAGYLTYVNRMEINSDPDKLGPFIPLFGNNSSFNLLVDEGFRYAMLGFRYAMLGLLFLLVLGCLSAAFWLVFIGAGENAKGSEYQYLTTGGNTLLTIAVFTWYLVTYNAEGTYKPDW